jgi:hypothetical protein
MLCAALAAHAQALRQLLRHVLHLAAGGMLRPRVLAEAPVCSVTLLLGVSAAVAPCAVENVRCLASAQAR